MCFSLDAMKWIREPKSFVVSSSSVEIVTEPHTDLWQNTYYHFCNDNAPVLFFETSSPYFSFVVKTDFSSASHRFDQCGIVVYQSSSCWLKASVEYESPSFGRLGSVVTNGGYSDWATTDIPTSMPAAPRIRALPPGSRLLPCFPAPGRPTTGSSRISFRRCFCCRRLDV